MSFGTPQFELKSQSFENKKNKYKKKKEKNKISTDTNTNKDEKDPMVNYPQLPEGWVKESYTGNPSYDETANEINAQMKRTIVI